MEGRGESSSEGSTETGSLGFVLSSAADGRPSLPLYLSLASIILMFMAACR